MQIKLFKTKKNFKKTDFHFNAGLYWGTMMGVLFVFFLAAAFFGYYLFMRISKETNLPSPGSGPAAMVKKERLDKASEYFRMREEKSADIINSPAPVVDPSL